MTCLEAQRFIRPFLEGGLSDQQTKQFLDHVEHCRSCMEELEINLTIQQMLNADTEIGKNAFNLKEQTRQRIQAARRKLLRHRAERIGGFAFLSILSIVLIGIIVLSILTLRSGDSLENLFRAENVKKHLRKEKKTVYVVETETDETEAENNEATEDVTEARTELPAEAITESAAEELTESAIEAITESLAEELTESAIEAITESAMEAITENAMVVIAEDTVEAVTESAMEAVTEREKNE